MNAIILDGKATAAALRATLEMQIRDLVAAGKRPPGLAVVLVGQDPASEVYVAAKGRFCRQIGMRSFEHRLAAEAGQAALLALIAQLNEAPEVDGILVQLPLPPGYDSTRILERIAPEKDVDGFHPLNVGRLWTGGEAFAPCTPSGAMKLIEQAQPKLAGLHAVVVGRSNIVGKPMAQMLLAADCTVSIAHSRTRNLAELCRTADILVAAVGRPEFLGAAHLKPGAIVIDVGINRIERAGARGLVGDCDYAAMLPLAGAITPVPGGVGPMTIACLLENTLIAYQRRMPGLEGATRAGAAGVGA